MEEVSREMLLIAAHLSCTQVGPICEVGGDLVMIWEGGVGVLLPKKVGFGSKIVARLGSSRRKEEKPCSPGEWVLSCD